MWYWQEWMTRNRGNSIMLKQLLTSHTSEHWPTRINRKCAFKQQMNRSLHHSSMQPAVVPDALSGSQRLKNTGDDAGQGTAVADHTTLWLMGWLTDAMCASETNSWFDSIYTWNQRVKREKGQNSVPSVEKLVCLSRIKHTYVSMCRLPVKHPRSLLRN